MITNSVLLAAVVSLGCVVIGCSTPPPVSPEAATVAMNDGRSIEQCTLLGLVSAKLPVSTMTTEPLEKFLTPVLRSQTAERQGNYLEAAPAVCSRGTPCAETGMAYRCPDTTLKSI